MISRSPTDDERVETAPREPRSHFGGYTVSGSIRWTTPRIIEPTDAIVRITATAICGSDLHLLDGYQPGMKSGDILGHEPMGIVEKSGAP